MPEIQELFDIEYPSTLIFNQQAKDESGIPFVSSKGTNNGISGRVKRNLDAKLYSKGSITVPLKGTVLHAFMQVEDFYCAHQIAVLSCKKEVKMSEEQKLFYVLCIRKNKYKYNYGRQADRTLKNLHVPKPDATPHFVHDTDLDSFNMSDRPLCPGVHIQIDAQYWEWFRLDALFDIKKGKRLIKANMVKGTVPFIGAISSNNGHREHIGHRPIHKGGTLTVNYNGSVAECFYQENPFWASDDVNVLYPKFPMNKYVALFLATIIRMEKYRFNYGRKWHLEKMTAAKIKLPVVNKGKLDLDFMENYIKSLLYSSNL